MNFQWFKKHKGRSYGAVVILLIVPVVWFLYTKGPLGPPKVSVTTVKKQAFTAGVFGIGTVDARLNYAIGPTQAGRVLKVFADQGDRVETGKLLGEMDPVDLDQKISAAAAALAKAQSSLLAAEAQVRDMTSRRNLAQASAKRYNALFAANAISQELADVKNNEANAALSAFESSLAALESARGEISRAAAEQAALLNQRKNLQLISPVAGLVVSRDAEPGATVVAGQTVFRLIDPATIWVRTRIDQAQFQGVAVGQTAKIILRSNPNKMLPGKVARLEVQADNVTEERFVNVVFDKEPGLLPLGELAEVTIDFAPIPDAIVVPAAAIKKQGQETGVWVASEGKLRFQPVEIGAHSLDGNVRVSKGLDSGETIVVFSSRPLAEGMRVRTEKKP